MSPTVPHAFARCAALAHRRCNRLRRRRGPARMLSRPRKPAPTPHVVRTLKRGRLPQSDVRPPRRGRLPAWTASPSTLEVLVPAPRPRYAASLRRRALADAMSHRLPGLSFLESAAVGAPTRRLYYRLWQEFIAFADLAGWLPLELERVDDNLTIVMDTWFFEGRDAEEGSKLIAAVKHAVPALRRHGTMRLPRAERGLAAWRKISPGRQRVPLPWLAVAAMVCYVSTVLQRPWIGAKWLLMFDTYLRPGEMDSLQVSQLVSPCGLNNQGTYGVWTVLLHPSDGGRPGKTGLLDETVIIDDHRLNPLMHWLTQHRHLDEKIWPGDVRHEVKLFSDVAAALHLHHLKPCRYSLRHAGASHDFLSRRHGATDIKRRGRWHTDGSVRRYGKESLAMVGLHKVSRYVRIYGAKAARDLAGIIIGAADPPPLPLLN